MPTNKKTAPKRASSVAAARKRPLKKKSSGKKTFWVIAVVVVIAVIAVFLAFRGSGPQAPEDNAGDAKPVERTITGDTQTAGPARETLVAMAGARLLFESEGNKDTVRVVVEKVSGNSGRPVTYRYEWFINGQPSGDGSDRLSGFKGGDRIAVKVTPFDEEVPGQPRTLTFDVQSVPPRVISEAKDAAFDGRNFSYQVRAVSHDGAKLSYSLASAPQGMTINHGTGAVNWQLTENDYGEHVFEVKVADERGATTTHTVRVDLPKP